MNYTLEQIEDNTGVLPRILAEHTVWEALDNSDLTGEQIEAIESEFVPYAVEKFVGCFNHNKAFRRVVTGVNSIDDLPHIYKYLEHWFDGWHKRQKAEGKA